MHKTDTPRPRGEKEVVLTSTEHVEIYTERGQTGVSFDGNKLVIARRTGPGIPSGCYAIAQPISGYDELRDIAACIRRIVDHGDPRPTPNYTGSRQDDV